VASVSTEHLTFERDGATAIVTMNRPEAKNALSLPMLVGMKDAWEEIDGNDDIRSAILTGAGGTFCAGMDLKAMGGSDAEKYQARMAEDPDLHWKALLRHYDVKKPLIAAVEGWAVAGGTEILQATHIRVAGSSAVFGVFEAKRGLFPLGGSTVRLRRQIPYTVAMDLLLTAREVPAEEALRIGLIGHVVPEGKALEKALEIAGVINANGPLAVEAILRSVRETEGMSEVDGLARELEIGWPVFSSNDAAEGQKPIPRLDPGGFGAGARLYAADAHALALVGHVGHDAGGCAACDGRRRRCRGRRAAGKAQRLGPRREIVHRLLEYGGDLAQAGVIDLIRCVRRAVIIVRRGGKELNRRNAGFDERTVVRAADVLRGRLHRDARHRPRAHEDERQFARCSGAEHGDLAIAEPPYRVEVQVGDMAG